MISRKHGFKYELAEQSELSELPELKDISASSEILRLKNVRMMRYYRLHRDMCNPNYSRKYLVKQYMNDVYKIDQEILSKKKVAI